AKRHWRENARKPFGQHRLSRTRRTYENDVVTAGSRNFHASFYAFLTFYITKIVFRKVKGFVEFVAGIDKGRLQRTTTFKKIDHFLKIFNTINIQSRNDSGLLYILFRKKKTFETFFLRFDCDWQRAAYGLQTAIKR